jgi:hypothetical protein
VHGEGVGDLVGQHDAFQWRCFRLLDDGDDIVQPDIDHGAHGLMLAVFVDFDHFIAKSWSQFGMGIEQSGEEIVGKATDA